MDSPWPHTSYLNCPILEDAPLVRLAQLYGTVFLYYIYICHLTRSDDISKHTIMHVINFPATF